ncbi:nucleoporin NUP188-like [Styela clava]
MKEDDRTYSMPFQELWRITVGRSCIKDADLVGNELNKNIQCLENCLKYYKTNGEESKKKLKNNKSISSNLQTFCLKLAEFLNLDSVQTLNLISQYSFCDFHGSKEKFNELLEDDRSHFALIGKITEYFFSERLHLLRIIKHVLSYFEDKSHDFQQEYAEIVNNLKSDLSKNIFSQYKEQFSSDPPSSKSRGSSFTHQVIVPFALQAVKEQCELLEILFMYYSHFEMAPDILLQLGKTFKDQGYGAGHPLLEVTDTSNLAHLLSRLNILQQLILIEGFDMEYLQRLAEAGGTDQHKLSQKKTEFKELDKIFCSLTEIPAISPVLLAWATIRYQILHDSGSNVTQRLGERVIEQKVWFHIMQVSDLHPVESDLPVATTSRNVLRRLLSCVTHSFHEDTLGDYGELMEAVTKVLSSSKTAAEAFWSEKKRGTGLHLLLSSASGYFPLHLSPMMKLLTALTSGEISSYEVFTFISNLPSVAEYLAARGTDDVESNENGSHWKLLMNKNLLVAGGFHHFKVPMGTVGNLIDTQLGAMVQWQTNVNGWKFFQAEIENLLQYRGQSSDLEVLGYVDKANLIYGLLEKLLEPLPKYKNLAKKNEIMENLEPFIEKIFPLIQRLTNMINPPLDLLSLCVRCLTMWLKCDTSINQGSDSSGPSMKNNQHLLSIITAISRIQFLPFSEQNFMKSFESAAKLPLHYVSELPAPLYPGIFGNVLANVERSNGRYPFTVAILDLIISLVERTIDWNSEMFEDDKNLNLKLIIAVIAPAVLYFLREIFPTFHKWRQDLETTDKIGLKCLNLCHIMLRSYNTRSANNDDLQPASLWSPIQHMTLNILTHSHSVDIILKLISIPVDVLHSLLASDPTSPSVVYLMEIIRFGFSVLNNILRLENDILCSNKTKEQQFVGANKDEENIASYLHSVLSTHCPGGPNLVSLVAGYLYHQHNSSLPRIALSLLRRISVAVPMSLHASLGQDVAAVRDILLSRIKSRTEDVHLKIGILEFLRISVQTQPGLLELFLDLEQIDKDNSDKGLKLGKSSCLSAVLELINKDMQGTYQLPAELHTACVKLLNSLWVDRRHAALKALRSYSTSSKTKSSFWNSFLLPLFSDNSPKEIAQSDLLETCAHILNTLGLENFYTTPSGKDPALDPIMKEFAEKDRYNHLSKVNVCVCKTLPRLNKVESESRLMFVAAWRTFVLASDLKDPVKIRKYINDIMMAVGALVEEIETHSGIVTALNLTSSLLLTLLHKSPKTTLVDFEATEKIFSKIVQILEDLKNSQEEVERSQIYLHAILLHLFAKLKAKADGKIKFSKSISIWLRISCSSLRLVQRDQEKSEKNLKRNVETSLLLIQTIQEIFLMNNTDEDVSALWLKIVIEESSFNLLGSVILRLISSAHLDDDGNALRASLSVAIFRLFSTVCRHHQSALAILNTGIMPEFCLKTTNTYTDTAAAQKKNWLNVYHLSLVLVQNMLDVLSHNFLDHALDFIGVHNDRIIQCLEAVRINQSPSILQEATFTTALLSSLSKSFIREWRFKLLHSYQSCIEIVASLCHSCVAMLLRPRLLQEAMEFSSKKDQSVQISTSTLNAARQTSVVSQKSISQDDLESASPKFLSAQKGLFSILGNCLAIFKHLSPDLCQILLDQTVDPEEYQPILSIGFSTPSLDQVSPPTFGTIINASNVSWKVISQSATNSAELTDIATYVMDTALTVAISQGMLLLKHPLVSHRDKQRLRRELRDELISCLRSANRHFRHSSGGVTSPQTSPSAGSRSTLKAKTSLTKQFSSKSLHRSSSTSIDRGMLDLVDVFVKGVLR